MNTIHNGYNKLIWWFETIDLQSTDRFVIGLLAMTRFSPAFVLRSPAITDLDRRKNELRTLFQDFQLGKELTDFAESELLLAAFGKKPFRLRHLSSFIKPFKNSAH